MRALTVTKIMWLTSVLIVAGCTVKSEDPGTQAGAGAVGGSAGMAAAGAGAGGMAAGTASQVGGTTGGTAGAGGAGAGGAGAGGAGAGGAGAGGAGAGGAGAGAGGDPDGGAGTGSGPDTTGFLEDCLQGGAQWGTEEMTGPCKSGISTYDVHTEFGPYGVRSEYNVGADFSTGKTAASDWNGLLPCTVFIDGFGADPVGSADLKMTHDLDFGLYSVFYPGDMPEGETFPLLTWGNGTCAMPEGYGPLLRYIASFGYIVVASNSVQVGTGSVMTKALDFMLAENADPESKYYQKIDVDKIGAMGHSQGSSATAAAAADARIKVVILFNGGTSAMKPYLAISGDKDLGGTAAGMDNAVQAAPRPAAWLWYHQVPMAVHGSTTGSTAPGHLTLMMESDRVQEIAVAWWDMMLKGKEEAKAMFIGDTCTLCDGSAFPSMWPPATSGSSSTPSLEYGHNTMLN